MDGVFGQLRQTLAVILSDSVSEFALSPNARQQKWVADTAACSHIRFPQAQPVKVAAVLQKLAAYHQSRGPPEAELAKKRTRESDLVARLIRR